MANTKYSGVNYADTQASPLELIDQGQYGGKLRSMYDTFVLTADLASGDTILMGGPIQEGSILVDLKITSDALGGSCTVNVGWNAVSEVEPAGGDTLMTSLATAFFSALPVSSATVANAHGSTYEGGGNGPSASTFWRTRVTSPIQVVIAENAVSSGAAGKVIACELIYIVD